MADFAVQHIRHNNRTYHPGEKIEGLTELEWIRLHKIKAIVSEVDPGEVVETIANDLPDEDDEDTATDNDAEEFDELEENSEPEEFEELKDFALPPIDASENIVDAAQPKPAKPTNKQNPPKKR